jgi:hypothetical protein
MAMQKFQILLLLSLTLFVLHSCKDGGSPAGPKPDPKPDPDAVPTRVELNITADTLNHGDELQLEATVYDQNDEVMSGAAVTWSSSDETIATVSESGLVTGTGEGIATIQAAVESVTAAAELTIMKPPVASVQIQEQDMVLRAGNEQQLHVVLRDVENNRLSGRVVEWTSSNPEYATVVDSTGLVTAVAPGVVTITVTSEGLQDMLTIYVEEADASAYISALIDLQESVLASVERSGMWWVYSVDVGGDGYQDVVVQHGLNEGGVLTKYSLLLFRNFNNTRFEKVDTGIPAWGRVVVVEDFNGDGLDDLFFADHGEETTPDWSQRTLGTNQLLIQDGQGDFVETTSSALPNKLFYSHGACAGDITGDGAADIIVTMLETEQVLINNGSGSFSVQNDFITPMLNAPGESSEESPIDLQPWACGMGDFRNTGVMDVILSNDGYEVPANYGDGNPNPYQAVDPFGNSLPQSAKLLFNNYGTELEYRYPESVIESPWAGSGTAAVGLNTLTYDFNRDGCLDFSVYSTDYVNAHKAEIYFGDCTGGFSEPQVFDLPSVDYLWEDIELADVDGDGWMDIVMSNNLADDWQWGGGNRSDMHVVLENMSGNFSLRQGQPLDGASILPGQR